MWLRLCLLTYNTCSCVSPTASASSGPGEAVQRGGGVTVADVEEHLANLRQYSKIRWGRGRGGLRNGPLLVVLIIPYTTGPDI